MHVRRPVQRSAQLIDFESWSGWALDSRPRSEASAGSSLAQSS